MRHEGGTGQIAPIEGKAQSPTTSSLKPERHSGLDGWRFIAAFAVILLHTADSYHFDTLAWQEPARRYVFETGAFVEEMCRFAVPFFFICSGYFLDRHRHRSWSHIVWQLFRRLGLIYLVWTSIYILAEAHRVEYLTEPTNWARWLLNGGPGFHLWFFPALLYSSAVALFLSRRYAWTTCFVVTGAIYIIGVVLEAYLAMLISNPPAAVQTFARNACLAPLCLTIGLWLSANGSPSRWTAWVLCFGGLALQLTEALALHAAKVAAMASCDFLFGTVPYATGIFLIALATKNQSAFGRVIGPLGTFSLGIYLIHVLFLNAFSKVLPTETLPDRINLALVIFVCSIASVFALTRIRAIQPVIR